MSIWSIASLNPVQRKIVEHKSGPALVIAGAGSGKTRVITHRVAQLIHSGIPASSILLLTFTNKAANEMAQRVGRALKNYTEQQKIIHGTFHSVGTRFLRFQGPDKSLTCRNSRETRQIFSKSCCSAKHFFISLQSFLYSKNDFGPALL